MFAFDVDDGGFDGCIHDISTGDHSYSKHDTSRTEHEKNGSVLPDQNDKELVDEARARNATSPHTTQVTKTNSEILSSNNSHSERVPSSVRRKEQRLPGGDNEKEKDKLSKKYWANHDISPSPKRQIRKFSKPVISEKVRLLESFSPPSHNLSTQTYDEVINLTQPQVAAHPQPSDSPDLQDHPISPSQAFVSPSEEAEYFGVAADSFVLDDLVDTSVNRSDAVTNGNRKDEDGVDVGDLEEATLFHQVGCVHFS